MGILTYQDLLKAQQENQLEKFLLESVNSFYASPLYRQMMDAEKYAAGENPFLDKAFQHLRTIVLDTGQAITLTPIETVTSNFFRRIVDQLVTRLWYNPVQFEGKERLGIHLDQICKDICFYAAIHGVCYGFWNLDRIEIFKATEYIPLQDERTGAHMAGIRIMQIDPSRPRYVQLYEVDGFTEWKQETSSSALILYQAKQTYTTITSAYSIGAIEEVGENYIGFPVVPMYVNFDKRSELTKPLKSKINVYDILETSYYDEFGKAKPLYYRIEGFSGNVKDLVQVRRQLEVLGIIAAASNEVGEIGQQDRINANTLEMPYNSHKEAKEGLENTIFRDAQVINLESIVKGNTTATAIRASAIAEDAKVRAMEQEVTKFIKQIAALQGLEIEGINFTHKNIMNETEIAQAEEAIARTIGHYVTLGLPMELFIEAIPWAKGREIEWRQALQSHQIGADTYSYGQSD